MLEWPATDVAAALVTTTAAVNSALQRARARLAAAGVAEEKIAEPTDAAERDLIDRYVVAFENADVAALERLLTEDAVLEMPPFLTWYVGRELYVRFIARVFALRGTRWRMVQVRANEQPALAAYVLDRDGRYTLHTLQVFTVTRSGISRNTTFQDPDVFAAFGLPAAITEVQEDQGRSRLPRRAPDPPRSERRTPGA